MSKIDVQESWIHTPVGRMYVKRWIPSETNTKAPIILFHDSIGSVELWRDIPEALALSTQREVIAYDRIGFGQSDAHPSKLELNFINDEIDGAFTFLIQTLQINEFVVFGHSVGGGMAATCAAKFQERCCALITESAQAFVEDRTIAGIREAKKLFAQKGQLERLEKYHGDKAAWVLSSWIDTWLSDGFQQWKLDESLLKLNCPVLAIHGDKDEYGSTKQPETIASLPKSPTSMLIIPDCGHIPHREQPDVVIEAVTSFLAPMPR